MSKRPAPLAPPTELSSGRADATASTRRRRTGWLWLVIAACALALVAVLPGVGASNAGYNGTTSNEQNSFTVYGDPVLLESVWWLDSSADATLFSDAGCTVPATNPGDPVECWVDRIDGSVRAIAASASASAAVSNTTIGGQRTLEFGAATDLRGPDRLGGVTSDMTFFVVTQAYSYTSNYVVSLNGTNTGSTDRFTIHMPYTNSNAYFDAGGCCTTNRSITNGLPLNTPLLFAGWKDSAAGYSYHMINDFGIRQSAGNTPAPTTGGLRLGYNAHHAFAELIVFDRTLTTAERDTVLQYLRTKWSLA